MIPTVILHAETTAVALSHSRTCKEPIATCAARKTFVIRGSKRAALRALTERVHGVGASILCRRRHNKANHQHEHQSSSGGRHLYLRNGRRGVVCERESASLGEAQRERPHPRLSLPPPNLTPTFVRAGKREWFAHKGRHMNKRKTPGGWVAKAGGGARWGGGMQQSGRGGRRHAHARVLIMRQSVRHLFVKERGGGVCPGQRRTGERARGVRG